MKSNASIPANEADALTQLRDAQDALAAVTRERDALKASQAPPPAPVAPPAVTAPRAPGAKTGSDTGKDAELLAEYETVRNDPKALAGLLADKEKGSRLRALAASNHVPDRQIEDALPAAVDEPQPVTAELLALASKPAPLTELAGIYERVKTSPVLLARFLKVNGAALRDLLIVGA